MFAFPSLYLLNEIIDQPVNVHESVGGFLVAEVLVIALAAFVVKADHPLTELHINKAVLEAVAGRRNRIRHPPSRPVLSSAMSRKRVISSAFMLATMPTVRGVVNVTNWQRKGGQKLHLLSHEQRRCLNL